jgi:hypothetical protein
MGKTDRQPRYARRASLPCTVTGAETRGIRNRVQHRQLRGFAHARNVEILNNNRLESASSLRCRRRRGQLSMAASQQRRWLACSMRLPSRPRAGRGLARPAAPTERQHEPPAWRQAKQKRRGASNNRRNPLSDTVMPLMSLKSAAGVSGVNTCEMTSSRRTRPGRGQGAGRLDAWYEFLLPSMVEHWPSWSG